MGLLDDLPSSARRRLESGAKAKRFSAHFTAGEFALLRDLGYHPAGQVMGVSVFQTGAQWTSGGWSNSDRKKALTDGLSYELTTSTSAFYQARKLAMGRMREEARQLGASLVLGARIESRHCAEASDTSPFVWEFRSLGTAVVSDSEYQTKPDPVLCNLSASEFWQLRRAGLRPVGMVAGNCNWLHFPSKLSSQLLLANQNVRRSFANQEYSDITQAMYQARELAMIRLDAEARNLHASGVLGLQVDADYVDPSHLRAGTARGVGYLTIPVALHYFALGTAVVGKVSPGYKVGSPMISLEN